jgi:hypothetical protein
MCSGFRDLCVRCVLYLPFIVSVAVSIVVFVAPSRLGRARFRHPPPPCLCGALTHDETHVPRALVVRRYSRHYQLLRADSAVVAAAAAAAAAAVPSEPSE